MTENQGATVSVIWPGVDELPVQRANAFLSQINAGPAGSGPEEVLLTVGYIAPPILLGTQQEQELALGALGAVAVKPLARLSLSRERIQELIVLLQNVAQQYDGAQS